MKKKFYLKNLALIAVIISLISLSSCDDCKDVNCLNGATCEEGSCQCPTGFSGALCEVEDECLSNDVSCENGGKCKNGTCECEEGYSGKNCNEEDRCITEDVDCLNGGECEDGDCECPPNYVGNRCQIYQAPADLCENVTCSNNQPCEDGLCDCNEWTTGDLCGRIVLDEKYTSSSWVDGEWYNLATSAYVADGSIVFGQNNDSLAYLDFDFYFGANQFGVYCDFSDTLTFDIPEQMSGAVTLTGSGEYDGSEWYIEIDDNNTEYFFVPL